MSPQVIPPVSLALIAPLPLPQTVSPTAFTLPPAVAEAFRLAAERLANVEAGGGLKGGQATPPAPCVPPGATRLFGEVAQMSPRIVPPSGQAPAYAARRPKRCGMKKEKPRVWDRKRNSADPARAGVATSGFTKIAVVDGRDVKIKEKREGRIVRARVALGNEIIGSVKLARRDGKYGFLEPHRLRAELNSGAPIRVRAILNAVKEWLDSARSPKAGKPDGSAHRDLRANRAARGPGCEDLTRRHNRPFEHKPRGPGLAGSGTGHASRKTAQSPVPNMSAKAAISKFAPAGECLYLYDAMTLALRAMLGIPRNQRVDFDSFPDHHFAPLIARTFNLLADKINNPEGARLEKARDTRALLDLFRFVEMALNAGFDIPVADTASYMSARDDLQSTPALALPADAGRTKIPRTPVASPAAREYPSNAARLVSQLLPTSRRKSAHGTLRKQLMSVLSQTRGRRAATLQDITDDELLCVIEKTFEMLVERLKQKRGSHNHGQKPREYALLGCLDEFVRGIKRDDNPIVIPFANTDEYYRKIRKYHMEGFRWRPRPKGRPEKSARRERPPAEPHEEIPPSAYTLTRSISPVTLADTDGYVKIGAVDSRALRIKATTELGRSLFVYAELGGEEIGFVRFERVGKGFSLKYRPTFNSKSRDRRTGARPIRNRAISSAIAEAFEKAGKGQ